MTWTTGIADLRTFLNDDPTDKPRYRKVVFGKQDGTNKRFKTFEPRRITDFTDGSLSNVLGVFVNDTKVTVTADDPVFGEFELQTAPSNTASLYASYYVQWFLDAELDKFLISASQWLQSVTDYAITQPGLRPPVLSYAAAEAYQKLAVKWAQLPSQEYKVQDDDPENSPIERYLKLSEFFRERAMAERKSFMTRQDRALQPLFGSVIGKVARTTPNR